MVSEVISTRLAFFSPSLCVCVCVCVCSGSSHAVSLSAGLAGERLRGFCGVAGVAGVGEAALEDL